MSTWVRVEDVEALANHVAPRLTQVTPPSTLCAMVTITELERAIHARPEQRADLVDLKVTNLRESLLRAWEAAE